MTIAVTGASGQLGRLLIDLLNARSDSQTVIALARAPAKLAGNDLETRAFDYDDAATLAPALVGIDTLVLVSSSEIGKRKPQHRAVIAAATGAGVKRIVYTSVLRADTSSLSVADEHHDTERALKASGVTWTILRNGWYNENYYGPISGAVHHGALIDSAGNGRISSAARADYAEAAAIVALADGHAGQIYELAGDEAWTLADLAGELSLRTGRDIGYTNLPEAEYTATLASAGVPEAYAGLIAGWGVQASHGALFDNERRLSSLLGRPTTPMSVSVAKVIQQA